MTVPHERFCTGFIRSWNAVTLRLVNLVNIIGFFFFLMWIQRQIL